MLDISSVDYRYDFWWFFKRFTFDVRDNSKDPMIEENYMLYKQASEQTELDGKVYICAFSRETGYDRKTILKYLQDDVKRPEQQSRIKPG